MSSIVAPGALGAPGCGATVVSVATLIVSP